MCACVPLMHASVRVIETLNRRALLGKDKIIERSAGAPSCDEHLRTSTCIGVNYLIG